MACRTSLHPLQATVLVFYVCKIYKAVVIVYCDDTKINGLHCPAGRRSWPLRRQQQRLRRQRRRSPRPQRRRSLKLLRLLPRRRRNDVSDPSRLWELLTTSKKTWCFINTTLQNGSSPLCKCKFLIWHVVSTCVSPTFVHIIAVHFCASCFDGLAQPGNGRGLCESIRCLHCGVQW